MKCPFYILLWPPDHVQGLPICPLHSWDQEMAALWQLHPFLCFTGEQHSVPVSIKSISKQWSLPRVSLCSSLFTSFSIHMQSWGFCPTIFSLLFLFPLETDIFEVSGSSLTFGSDLCSSLGDSCQPGTQQRRQDSGALQKRAQPLGEKFPI